jgi:hypothetical protein
MGEPDSQPPIHLRRQRPCHDSDRQTLEEHWQASERGDSDVEHAMYGAAIRNQVSGPAHRQDPTWDDRGTRSAS